MFSPPILLARFRQTGRRKTLSWFGSLVAQPHAIGWSQIQIFLLRNFCRTRGKYGLTISQEVSDEQSTKQLTFLDEGRPNMGIYSCMMSFRCHITIRANRCSSLFKFVYLGAVVRAAKKNLRRFFQPASMSEGHGGEGRGELPKHAGWGGGSFPSMQAGEGLPDPPFS